MQRIIVLRGAPASGKSSIAKKMRDLNKKTAWLKVDNFKPFFSDDNTLESLKFVNRSAYAVLEYLAGEGFTVIMEGVFQDTQVIDLVVNYADKKGIPCKVFQIECSFDELKKRDLNREGVKEGCRKPMDEKVLEGIFERLRSTLYKGSIRLDTQENNLNECIKIINESFASVKMQSKRKNS